MACTVAHCRQRADYIWRCHCGLPVPGVAVRNDGAAGGRSEERRVVQAIVDPDHVGSPGGVAAVVHLLRASVEASNAIAKAYPGLLGDEVWGPLSALFQAMERRADVETCFVALTWAWRTKGILRGLSGGDDPADVLLRLLHRPSAIGSEISRLVAFTISSESSCPTCGARDETVTQHFTFVMTVNSRSLQSQVDRLARNARPCACGGTSHGSSASWSDLGALLLVQGDSPFNAIPSKLRLRVASERVDLALVAVFEDCGVRHPLHLRRQGVKGGAEWVVFDGTGPGPTTRAANGGEGVFRLDGALQRSSLWAYARQPIGGEHALNIGIQHPCDFDCGVAACHNQITCDSVREGACQWLSGQKGLFASADLRKGSWIARFATSRSPATGGEKRAEGTFLMRVRRLTDRGLGTMCATLYLQGGVAMLANATCCLLHRNAEIAQDADDNVWIRLVADVRAEDEILVDYGEGFFMAEPCVCCLCAGRCTPVHPTEHASGGR